MSGRGGGRGQYGGRGGRGGGRGRGRGRGHHAADAHDGNKQHSRKAAAPVRVKETEEQREARKSYGSWKRRLGKTEADPTNMRRLWEGALGILEAGDRDWRQQLPQDLNDDEGTGPHHILAMLSTKVVGADFDTFINNARNFLLTLTHPSLLRCLAVDTHVGSLYSIFGGVGGKRAMQFLQRLCDALLAARVARASLSSTGDIEATLLSATLALFELLRRERRMRLNEDIPTLVDSIQATSDVFKNETSSSFATRISNRLNDVRALVARTQSLISDDKMGGHSNADDIDDNISFYPQSMVVPSDRFDNDKRDIADMIIFPTRDEIMSDEKEFLPYTNPDQPHFLDDPVQRHIDTYFRLLRHDIFGEMKGALAGVMHTVTKDPTASSDPRLHLGDVRANHYLQARISYVTLDSRKGLQAQIEFLQPGSVRKQSAAARAIWWDESRRLEEGTLLSFVWLQGSKVQHSFFSVSDKKTEPHEEYGLSKHNNMAYITSSLVTQDQSTVKLLMQANIGASRGILLEFPKVMPATFEPILENLKGMHRLNRLPFRQWIIPEKQTGPSRVQKAQDIPPALYARAPGFRFPLGSLAKDKTQDESFSLEPTSSCDDVVLVDKLETKTQLDRGQCRALIAALTREYAFIQGPPGTGKSYLGLQIMKVLLDIKEKADLGPILIVCYTNHALDQFLEHLIDIGVQKLVRVGGMSKSKKLANHNLRTVSDLETKTKSEKYMAAMRYRELENKEKEAKSVFAALHGLQKRPEWHSIKGHIHEDYPNIYKQFRQVDEEGFKTAGRHPFDVWRTGTGPHHVSLTTHALQRLKQKAERNIYSLTTQERSALVAHWIEEAQGSKIGELYEIAKGAMKTQRELINIHEELNRRVLEEADVIGVTTSGLAKRISVLQQVKCKVIICEEAGEVMEPHMLSATLGDVEHLIQIGDHEQLRPSVSNFRDLSLESERGKLHQLDRSQFERLSIGEPGRPLMPVAQLNVQRRMRPQISTLIRETIYDKLKDHATTAELPDVVGMRQNVFWFDHHNHENGNDADVHNTKSKSNLWEVKMVHALVRHVVRQGVYKPDDIAVLTPYTGQLQKLRATMRSDFEICLSDRDREALEKDGFTVDDNVVDEKAASNQQGYLGKPLEKKQLSEMLRIATVDNFQGEEAKIIIVSLVRSNEKRNVGFLKTTNRINVLLSRAQHGMYLIGNTDTYSSVEMWQKVIGMLRAADSVGERLALCCPRHPETAIEVQQPDDFQRLSPEGGCALNPARYCFTVGILVREVAGDAIPKTGMTSRSSNTLLAGRRVAESMGPVTTVASVNATTARTVACVKTHAKCVVNTRGVHKSVMSLVLHVSSRAYGPASIKAIVKCLVQPHAIAFRAMSAVPSFFHVQCGMKSEELPDMVMMSRYADIDLNESPIVILGCGHFFTSETLDGHIGLKDVYDVDIKTGRFIGLIENVELAASVPQCPNCREPIKQYITQRYNRLINRAVIDEMSKRFIVSGQQELQQLKGELDDLRNELEDSRESVVPLELIRIRKEANLEITMQFINDGLKNRSHSSISLMNSVKSLQRRMQAQHQPTYKLHQATVHAVAKMTPLDIGLSSLVIDASAEYAKRDRDQRITLGGNLLEIKVRCLVLEDNFEIAHAVGLKRFTATMTLSFPGGSPETKIEKFLQDCMKLINECLLQSLPKLAVEVSLCYARIAHLFGSSGLAKDKDRVRATGYRDTAKELLEKAKQLCKHSFRDREVLLQAIISTTKMLRSEFYEAVSKEEVEAIKKAMVSGPGGIATHSGHWYKCVNGHPFAIGECGMPMQLARCPECGQPVGGQSHTAVAGVSRATEMEV
ncbi:AAA-12 multi-domain protein [Pyrenophora tritici-repentis]|nr:AAA-12 multi-domain protein [Pyrenophora tritici-repentis]